MAEDTDWLAQLHVLQHPVMEVCGLQGWAATRRYLYFTGASRIGE